MELASWKPHQVPTQGIKINRGGSLEQDALEIELLQTGQKLVIGPMHGDKEDENESCCHTPCSWGIDPCTGRILESPTLQHVRKWGVEVIRDTMFPVFSRIGSAVAALIGLLTALTLFILAVPMAAKQESTFDYIRVSTTSVGLVLALVDVAIVTTIQKPTISKFSCHKCFTIKRHVKTLQDRRDSFIQSDPTLSGAIDQPWPATWKTKIIQFMVKYSDILRLIIIESLIYPSLVCGILERAALTHTHEGERLQIAHFVLTIFWHIVNVYIIRVIIVGSAIITLEKMRRGNKAIGTLYRENLNEGINLFPRLDSSTECKDVKDCEEDKLPVPTAKSYACHGLPFQIRFFLHIMGQMIAQDLMLWAIWAKVECENTNDAVYISPFMWYMIAGGYVLPILGTLTFFISNYFWMQEFPVFFMLDLFKKRDIITEMVKDAREKSNIFEWITMGYAKLNAIKCFTRFSFPFTNPFLVLLSFFYSTALLTFTAFIFVGVRNGAYILCHTTITILDEPSSDVVMSLVPPIGMSEEILCLLMSAILIVLNIHVLLIVGFWIVVAIAMVLLLIAPAFVIATDISVVISVLVFVTSNFATMGLCVVLVVLFGVGI